jgi:hypothetical protein
MMNRALIASSLVLAIAWTAAMYIWERPQETSGLVILIVSGILFGILWCVAMGWWLKRQQR